MFTKTIIDEIQNALSNNPDTQEVKIYRGVFIVRETNETLLNKYREENWVNHGTITFNNHRFIIFIG